MPEEEIEIGKKRKRDMKVRGILYIVFMVCLMAGCQDDFEEGGMGGELSDGAVTLRFAVQDAAEIYTRADDPSQDAIENVMLAVALGITMIAVVIMAKCIGCVLPLLARKIGLDPAIMAAPLITTVLDTCTILVYFNIVTAFFKI